MVSIEFATRLAPWLAPDEAHGSQHAKQQGWQRVSFARSISQDVLPDVARPSRDRLARLRATIGEILASHKTPLKIRGNACPV